MKMMLLGSPGVGKGTQAALICEHFGIPQISTGNILRAAIESESDLGLSVRSILDAGQLVPDEIVNALVKERLSQADCEAGFLLDGFPRTIMQAQYLVDNAVSLDYVIVLEIDNGEVVKRLSGRRVHLASGRTYHVDYNPPQKEGVDDLTGEALVQRDDDTEEVVLNRLNVYRTQTSPLIDFYQVLARKKQVKLITFSGVGAVEEINKKILSAIS